MDKLEKRIKSLYRKASQSLYKDFSAYMARAEKQVANLEKTIRAMKAIGQDTSELEKMLIDKKKSITLQSRVYKQKIENITRHLAETNAIALAYANGELPEIYTINYNQKPEGISGYRFDIVDESTIMARVNEGNIQLPKKKLDIPKDMAWNTKQLNSAVLQGIINGESMQKIARRILPITDRNKTSAIRNARTMVTGAENQGRNDRYNSLEEGGLMLKKIWIATPDKRVRDFHLSMDGQEVGIHEMFVDGHGNLLEYPADPRAKGETVWNCRCSMYSRVVGFRK